MCAQPTTEQADALQEAFVNSTSARQHGIHFNGATYKCIRADKESIYAKKVNVARGTLHRRLYSYPRLGSRRSF